MKNRYYKIGSMILMLAFIMSSCTSDDRDVPMPEPTPMGSYNEGVFILNEGGFGYSNASISFLDSNGEVYNSIYTGANGFGLGDVAQSMGLYGDNAYIVVNNSSTIEVVNRYTFEHVATVTAQIVNPRYIEFNGDKGYISNWGDPNNVNDDYVAVLNLETNLVESKIPVAEGPEKMLSNNGKLYVAQKGGYAFGNAISVVDLASQSLITSIAISDVPDGMVINNNTLYVMCSGKGAYTQDETLAKLHSINLSNTTVTSSLSFPQGKHPRFLEFENNNLYYAMDNAVYSIATSDSQLPQVPKFTPSSDGVEVLYGFAVHEGLIYIADAKDYTSNGEAFIYNRDGALQQRFSVQIIPNSFYFNNL